MNCDMNQIVDMYYGLSAWIWFETYVELLIQELMNDGFSYITFDIRCIG